MRCCLIAAAAWLAMAGAPICAQDPAPAHEPSMASRWHTLGTHGGPVPNASRSQPANLLLTCEEVYLVDVGDGAAGQMAKLGIPLQRVNAIFLSHLHFDHTGGLAGVLGLRFQTEAPGSLTIYGPPGTAELVEGIIASMVPGGIAGYGVPGEEIHDPAKGIDIVEWSGGENVAIGSMQVRNVVNTHYSFTADSPQYGRFASLSFRFELADRSILYTGDTGPSQAVDLLGAGADLLVAEMIDLDALLASMGPARGDPAAGPTSILVQHLADHHITPTQIGQMAAAMDVKQVVVTHIVAGNARTAQFRRYAAEIQREHDVPVVIANDLDGF